MSTLFPDPTTLKTYEIQQGWVNPDNTPPMEADAQAHSSLLHPQDPPNLRTALRHDRFKDRCTRYVKWTAGIHDTIERLCPLNDIIVELAKEVLSNNERRSEQSEQAIMRTALSLSGIYQWIYEDRKQALAIHTELTIHYHPLDISSTPHLTEIDDMIERKRCGTVDPFDMYDDTKLTRRNYASSYAQVIQHAIRALNLLPPSGNRTHEDRY